MSDNSHASVKRKTKKKTGDSSPGISSKSKKVRRVDKSSRSKSRTKKTSTPVRSPIETKEASTPDVKTEKKVDPEVLKAIKEGRENFVHNTRRGTKLANFTFPPGRIYTVGTDPKTVPVVPTTKMKDEMRGMSQRTSKKKTKQRKYLAEKTSNTTTSVSDIRNVDKSSASRKKSRSKMRGRRKDTPIPPK